MKFNATWDQRKYIPIPGMIDADGTFEMADSYVEKVQDLYTLEPVPTEEAESEHLHWCCLIQDVDTLYEIQQRICDPDITAAAEAQGELYVRYGFPSFRSGGQWFCVVWKESK